jgi:hypothetical protein
MLATARMELGLRMMLPPSATTRSRRRAGIRGRRAHRAGGVPDPELVEWAERRSFTAKCKLEILAKLEAGTRLGEVGELLRREGLYTSHLTYWRKQVRDAALKELDKPRGDKPADRGAPQCAKLVGERVPARTTAFVIDRPDHPRPHRRHFASVALAGSALPPAWESSHAASGDRAAQPVRKEQPMRPAG